MTFKKISVIGLGDISLITVAMFASVLSGSHGSNPSSY